MSNRGSGSKAWGYVRAVSLLLLYLYTHTHTHRDSKNRGQQYVEQCGSVNISSAQSTPLGVGGGFRDVSFQT